MTHWHYFRHDPSGEAYAISVGENGMFGDIAGPLHHSEVTPGNLTDGFDPDPDDQEWMGRQTWAMLPIPNPACDCPTELTVSPETLRHTPGPWTPAPHRDGHDTDVVGPNGEPIGDVATHEAGEDAEFKPYLEGQANLRLVTAAPDMFVALEAIVARISGEWDHPSLVRFGPQMPDTVGEILRIAEAGIKAAAGT